VIAVVELTKQYLRVVMQKKSRKAVRNGLSSRFPLAKRLWGFIVGLGVVIGILSGIPAIRQEVLGWFRHLDIDLAWYEKDEKGALRMVPLNDVRIVLTEDDILNHRVRLPIHLAVRNHTGEPIDIARLEITYYKSLDVRSEAKNKVAMEPGRIVYEHDLGFLPASESFTPLDPVDVLSFPNIYALEEVIAMTRNGIPIYLVTILRADINAMQGGFKPVKVRLGLTINAKGYTPIKGTINLIQDPISVAILWPSEAKTQTRPIDPGTSIDIERWKKGTVLTQWEGLYNRKKSDGATIKLQYQKKKSSTGAIVQFVKRDGILRRIDVDDDGDGFEDRILLDTTGDGRVNEEIVFMTKVPMLDWKADALH